jgi:hypothetical protein
MSSRSMRDIVSGTALIALGMFVSIYAFATLNLGSPTRMGPGLFPFALGILLALLGILIVIPALVTPGPMEKVAWRSIIAVTASICVFAGAVRPLGIIPAIIMMIVVATLAETKIKPLELLGLVVLVPLAAWLIFIVGLGVPLPLIRWPF